MCNRTNAAVLLATATTLTFAASAAPPVFVTAPADLTDSVTAFEIAPLFLPAEGGASFTATVPFEGELLQLQLFSYTMRSDRFELLVDPGDGSLVPVQPDAPRTYRGSIVGLETTHSKALAGAGSVCDGARRGGSPGRFRRFVRDPWALGR